MRKRPVIASVVASLALLGFGWKVGVDQARTVFASTSGENNASSNNTANSTSDQTTQPSTAPTVSPSSSATPSSTSSASAAPGKSGTFTGNAIQTRYGVVQVKVTVKNSKVADVTTVQMTAYEGRSQQIDANAEPILTSEAKQAGSANINTVSGATYTSDGYIQSLQSALDKAGL